MHGISAGRSKGCPTGTAEQNFSVPSMEVCCGRVEDESNRTRRLFVAMCGSDTPSMGPRCVFASTTPAEHTVSLRIYEHEISLSNSSSKSHTGQKRSQDRSAVPKEGGSSSRESFTASVEGGGE